MKFLEWFLDEVIGNLGFNKVMITLIKQYKITKGMAFNALIDLIMLTVITIYTVTMVILKKPDEILKGIDRFLGFTGLCILIILSEKYWQTSKNGRKKRDE